MLHVQVREEGEVLEYHPYPALLGRQGLAGPGDQVSLEVDLPAADGLEAGDGAQQGRLAAAAGSEQAADGALTQGEAHISHDRIAR